jgi:hypothetical protein
VAKIHPNNPTLRNPKFAQEVFDHARQPAAWLRVGCRLRSSADAIFERENPVATRFWDELHRIGLAAAAENSPPENFDESKFPFPNFDAAYMLVAFAIENLLKGLAIAKRVAVFSAQELPVNIRTHDLDKLHKLAAAKATISQHVLDSLTYMSEWRARYPFPTSVEKFWPMHDSGAPKAAGFNWPDSHLEFLSYCDGLEGELRALL